MTKSSHKRAVSILSGSRAYDSFSASSASFSGQGYFEVNWIALLSVNMYGLSKPVLTWSAQRHAKSLTGGHTQVIFKTWY